MMIRDIDETTKRNAKLAAAANGRSLQGELKALVDKTYARPDNERAARIRAMSSEEFVDHLIKVANGATLEIPDRLIDNDRDIFSAD